jgi:hypothetical protein
MLDKIRLALPRELDAPQRAALVTAFMAELAGDDRVPWFAAIHQTGKDAHNPHVHIAVHDRDPRTGRRVLRLSDNARDRQKAGLPGPKAVEWIRERWEHVCNRSLEQAGIAARIDRRTLDAQGIEREPAIHEGPRAAHIEAHVKRPRSKPRVNGCGREIDYPAIDRGLTRREFNARVIDLNLERAARSANPETAAWAAFEKDQLARDRALEERLAGERHERGAELRAAALVHAARIKRLRAERALKLRAARKTFREKADRARAGVRIRQAVERAALKDRQSRLYQRVLAILDITGVTRRRQETARKTLAGVHREQRQALTVRLREERRLTLSVVRERYAQDIAAEQARRIRQLAQIKELHRQAEAFADHDRQVREAEREHARKLAERHIEARRGEKAKGDDKRGGRGKSEGAGEKDSFTAAFARAAARLAREDQDRTDKSKSDERETDERDDDIGQNHRRDRDFER